MIGSLAEFCRGVWREGFAGARVAGEMTWALRSLPGPEELLDYEVLLNDFFEGAEGTCMTGICQYDARLFDGQTILHLLEVHPFLILRGQILRNPNFMRPEEKRRRALAEAAA